MSHRTSRAFFASLTGHLILALSLISSFALAQGDTRAREILPFDNDWLFHLGDTPGANQPVFEESGWTTLDVPHDWSIEGPLVPPPEGDGNNGFFRHGIGWYRKHFASPNSSKKTVLEFDGVYMNSDVWINGHFLGRRPYGFIGFRYDVTEYLTHDGSENVLSVRVDDSAEPSTRWYSGSGIYRHVRLISTNFTGFRLDGGVRITTPQVTADEATVDAGYIIDANFFSDNERLAWARDIWHTKPVTRRVMIHSDVLDSTGQVAASSESEMDLQDLLPGQSALQHVRVPKPLLWSSDSPKLYQLRSTLLSGGEVLDQVTTSFGIRDVKFEPEHGLFINGKSTKLKGVCIHQDAGSFGNAVPIEVWTLRLSRLKEMGCNAIRPSHHPFAPEFYDLCDRMGFYVFDESFDEWTRGWSYNFTENPRGKAPYGYHLYFSQWHDTDLRAMLRRDRNHPCVLLWSIGNEIPNQFDRDGYQTAKELVSICHDEDPTRPATSACDQSFVSSRNGFMDQLDIMGYNYIDRLYSPETYAPEHDRFPQRLLMGTETGSANHMWLGVRNHDYVIGEFVWTGIDYLGEAGNLPRRGSQAGFIDLSAGRTASFFQRAAYWRDEPVLKLLVSHASFKQAATDLTPATNVAGPGGPAPGRRREPPAMLEWIGTPGVQMNVRAATNCDEVELFLNDQSLGKQVVDGNAYQCNFALPFKPGTLTAVGYKAGKQVAKDALITPATPSRLQIANVSLPSAEPVLFYEITVTDHAGVPVLDAAPSVSVKIEGPGKLIGLDTADLTYAGLFKTDTRVATGGRVLATVLRTSSGQIHISAAAPELETGNAVSP